MQRWPRERLVRGRGAHGGEDAQVAETPHWPAKQEGMQVKALLSQPKLLGGVQGQMAGSQEVKLLPYNCLHAREQSGRLMYSWHDG